MQGYINAIVAVIMSLCSGAILGVLLMWRDVSVLKRRADDQERTLGEIKRSLEAIPTIQNSIVKIEGHIEALGQRMSDFMESCASIWKIDNGIK